MQQGLNSTIHKTINAVPSEVFFGYRLRTDSDSLAPQLDDEPILDVDVTTLPARTRASPGHGVKRRRSAASNGISAVQARKTVTHRPTDIDLLAGRIPA
ncbi:unnamed protein product [Diatraea saccharalis]|uniref:Uncharacterized protein n=1 Tax=Diatraea saccharalis TaxID=40085 RepID=A0A9N9QSS5_9NEOP|nr:unnamed protein product [Diatraea saccharalis]